MSDGPPCPHLTACFCSIQVAAEHLAQCLFVSYVYKYESLDKSRFPTPGLKRTIERLIRMIQWVYSCWGWSGGFRWKIGLYQLHTWLKQVCLLSKRFIMWRGLGPEDTVSSSISALLIVKTHLFAFISNRTDGTHELTATKCLLLTSVVISALQSLRQLLCSFQ